jgi:hypothetical protein
MTSRVYSQGFLDGGGGARVTVLRRLRAACGPAVPGAAGRGGPSEGRRGRGCGASAACNAVHWPSRTGEEDQEWPDAARLLARRSAGAPCAAPRAAPRAAPCAP